MDIKAFSLFMRFRGASRSTIYPLEAISPRYPYMGVRRQDLGLDLALKRAGLKSLNLKDFF